MISLSDGQMAEYALREVLMIPTRQLVIVCPGRGLYAENNGWGN